MFFFIGGVQPKTVRLEKQARACPYCSHFDVFLKRVDQYISVFFIPILRIKKGVPFVSCENCNVLLEGAGMDTGGMRGMRGGEEHCASCGRAVDSSGYSFCPYCGKPL